MTSLSRSEERWRVPYAAPRRAGTEVQRLQGQCCGARLVALTFPPVPFRSRTAGAEGGMMPPHLPLGPLPLLHGERKGET